MKNKIRTRDYFMKALILGSVKAGIHPDNRKGANAAACRGTKKMYAARKNAAYDVTFEWTREGEHGEAEVFDIYAKQTPTGYEIVRADIVDEDGESVTFNLISFSDEEMIALRNAAADEWDFQHRASHH